MADADEVDVPSDTAVLVMDADFAFFCLEPYLLSWHWPPIQHGLRQAFIIQSDAHYPIHTLVAHMRSGDIFKPGDKVLGYAQPPLAWYRMCIRSHRHYHGAVKVIVVAEDDKNPCVNGLVEWCKSEKISVRLQSATFEQDYLCLMRAQALIVSRGTFCRMAEDLNPRLRLVYKFDITSCGDRYVVERDWHCRPEQVERMLSIREEEIEAPADLYTASLRRLPVYEEAVVVPEREEGVEPMNKVFVNVLTACIPVRDWRHRAREALFRWPEPDRLRKQMNVVYDPEKRFTTDAGGVDFDSSLIPPPPNTIPGNLFDDFTLNDTIPAYYRYYDDSAYEPFSVTAADYEESFRKFDNRSFSYYGEAMEMFYPAAERYPLRDKVVIVFGLANSNLEAFALWQGAKQVIVIEYNKPICEHDRILVMNPKEAAAAGLQADVDFSFSSFEHDGLGRYGDPIAPNADLEAMKFARSCLRPDGIMYFGVPLGADSLAWNAHRIYGRIRLPMLLDGWRCVDVFDTNSMRQAGDPFEMKPGPTFKHQPLLILKRTDATDGQALVIEHSRRNSDLRDRINDLPKQATSRH
ncbi:MAG: DUF268 domain-containing protein [Planctomycetes bacterium]|nr:DUF268 domain-containing protein [Planctomycetota bacterium]